MAMNDFLFRSFILLSLAAYTLQSSSIENERQESRNLRKAQTIVHTKPQQIDVKKKSKGKGKDKKTKDKKKKKSKTPKSKNKIKKNKKSKGKKEKRDNNITSKGKGKKSKGKGKGKGKKDKKKKLPKYCDFQNISTAHYQDGECDLLLNNYQCYYDGGDCYEFNTNYPDCKVSKPTWVGDSFCDGAEYNTTECGYDGGDCLNVMNFGCSGAANGYCENMFNTEECDYDGGDCQVFNERFPDCKVPNPAYVGDGLCDIEPYYTEECGYDGGDCDDFPVNCTVTDTYAIGDGNCNLEYNTTECEYDGGDCMNTNVIDLR